MRSIQPLCLHQPSATFSKRSTVLQPPSPSWESKVGTSALQGLHSCSSRTGGCPPRAVAAATMPCWLRWVTVTPHSLLSRVPAEFGHGQAPALLTGLHTEGRLQSLNPRAVLQQCPGPHAINKSPVKPQAVQVQDRQVASSPGQKLFQFKIKQRGNKVSKKWKWVAWKEQSLDGSE